MYVSDLIAELEELPRNAKVRLKLDIPMSNLRLVGFFKEIKIYNVEENNTVVLRGIATE